MAVLQEEVLKIHLFLLRVKIMAKPSSILTGTKKCRRTDDRTDRMPKRFCRLRNPKLRPHTYCNIKNNLIYCRVICPQLRIRIPISSSQAYAFLMIRL